MNEPKPTKPGVGISDDVLRAFADRIKTAIEAGYARPGTNPGAGQTTALRVAAKELGLTKNQADGRLRTIRAKGFDAVWHDVAPAAEASATVTAPEPPKVEDRVRERRLEREVAALKVERKDMLDRIIAAEDLRATVFELARAIEAPAVIRPMPGDGRGGRRSVILHISDVHAGEAVDLYEMDGLNAYSLDICRARMERLFQKTASLLTDHWKGDPVEDLIVCLGGDMIDNNLREESRRGGAAPVVPSIKAVSETVAGGLAFLRSTVGMPIRVYTSPGNHGRLTPKPHSSEGNIDNLDMIVSWGIEKMLAGDPGVQFYYTGSGEALFNVYGWKFLLQHGHEGASGTGGLYGAVYKQVRGMYRAHQSYARRGRGFHFVLQGHDHTSSKIPFGFANGSVVGYNPYAMRKLKADPSPASQNLLIVEEKLGVIAYQELFLGTPDEGSLYEPPAIDMAGVAEVAA
ncbi:metallophosphoesterase [Mesorhizobium sp. CAU 1732]|uniref:metallophosphoesterase n=1 Tax=Mesorhizobium sp. CAU 1732 TaxID=3140358 RepID=UPI003261A924